ncbi:GntR family transcriptional regulator [Streptomyces noursei]
MLLRSIQRLRRRPGYVRECERVIRGLHRDIRWGVYALGAPLPRPRELAATYRVACSTTVLTALECLVRQGVLARPPRGGGVYVVRLVPAAGSVRRPTVQRQRGSAGVVHLVCSEAVLRGAAAAAAVCGIGDVVGVEGEAALTLELALVTCGACRAVYSRGAWVGELAK